MPAMADEQRRLAAVERRCDVAPVPDPELLEAAIAVERDQAFWRTEFAWLLRHPAVGAMGGALPAPLAVGSLAGEHALRFPAVSGDVAWLGERCVPVVARRLAPLLAQGAEVGLDLSVLERGVRERMAQREQMRLVVGGFAAHLPAALERFGIVPRGLAFSVSADHPGIGELLRLRSCAALGRPRVALRVPDALMLALRRPDGRGEGDWPGDPLRLWQGLTSLAYHDAGVHLVFQHTTRPACALAGHERGDAVLPASLFEARAETAWPALRLALDELGAASPAAALQELRRLLAAGLRLADNLVDQLDWTSPELAQDALVNRRLALHVTGIGDLVDRWGLDPAAFPSASLAMRWLGMVRRLLLRESNALARQRGPFPGLALRDIESTLSRSLGDEHARRLLRRAGLRHRHLLVLSPYALLPRRAARRPLPAYLNLLPVLRWADTVATCGDGVARALPVAVFRRLLRTTWAVARNRP